MTSIIDQPLVFDDAEGATEAPRSAVEGDGPDRLSAELNAVLSVSPERLRLFSHTPRYRRRRS